MPHESSAPPRGRVAAAFAAIYLVWGSTYLAILFAIETLPPFLMAGARFLIAGALLYLWERSRGAPAPAPVHWRAAAVVGGLLLLGGNGGVVWAELHVPTGIAALLVATVPLWMVLLDWARPAGRRPSLTVGTGVLVGLGGIVLLVGPGALADGASVHPGGAAVLVLASLSWAIGSLYSRGAPRPGSPFLATAMQMLAGGSLLLAFGAVVGEPSRLDLAGVSTRSWLAWLYLIAFGSLIGYTSYIWLLKATTPARVSTYAYVNPVVAVALGWAFAGERLAPRTFLAAAIIIAAVALITLGRSHARSAPAPPAAPPPEPEPTRRVPAGTP